MVSQLVQRLDQLLDAAQKKGLNAPGYAGLWQLGLGSLMAGMPASRPLYDAEKMTQHLARRLAVQPDAASVHAATRLKNCLATCCGSAACPLCRTVIDPVFLHMCKMAVETEPCPKIVIWKRYLGAGSDSFDPAAIREDLDRRMREIGVDPADTFGRMSLGVECHPKLMGESGDIVLDVRETVSVMHVVCSDLDWERKLDWDGEASGSALQPEIVIPLQPGPSPEAPTPEPSEIAHFALSKFLDRSAKDMLLDDIEAVVEGKPKRKAIRLLTDKVELGMARRLALYNYTDLLVGNAPNLLQPGPTEQA